MQSTKIDGILPRIDVIAAAENYGRFKLEPLEVGHGIALGNALRRVLLSSIPGAAITRVRITGLLHEFSPIPGVREDGTQLVLNIKGIRLRCYAERPVTLYLFKQGAGPVRAGDISAPSTVEIVNPNHYLCTIEDDDAALELHLTAERGRGAVLADSVSDLPIGEIAVDALFSPIVKVNFVVETHGAQPGAAHERLLIEIWTDGTIKPGDALSHAGQILAQYFAAIASFSQPQPAQDQALAASHTGSSALDALPLDALGLSSRTYNSLRRAGFTQFGQLLALGERELFAIRNLGQKSAEEIRDRLAALSRRDTGSELALVDGDGIETLQPKAA